MTDPSDFCGGGTYFEAIDTTIMLQPGEMIVHPGSLKHSGVDITSGVRHVLVVSNTAFYDASEFHIFTYFLRLSFIYTVLLFVPVASTESCKPVMSSHRKLITHFQALVYFDSKYLRRRTPQRSPSDANRNNSQALVNSIICIYPVIATLSEISGPHKRSVF